MDNNTQITTGANASGQPFTPAPPPPPPGFIPDQSAQSPAIPPPPSGFMPEQSQTVNPTSSGPTLARVANDTDVVGNLETGALHGLSQTGAGIMGLSEKLANPSGDPNNERQWFNSTKGWLDQHSQNTGTDTATRVEQSAGTGIETVAEFLLGDEALKGLPLSERLATVSKVTKALESHPIISHIVDAGLRGLRGTAVGAVQGGVKSGGNATDAGEAGIGAGLANLVLPEIGMAAKAAPRLAGALSDAMRGAERVVQPELQGSIRQILSDVAADHGITVPDQIAMRDHAEFVGQGIKAKASAIYRAIDDALEGTKFQSYDDQLSAVRKAIRTDTGIDHDYTGKLVERLNELTDAKAAAQQKAIDAGINPDAFNQANAYWRQGSAVQDLSAKIRQSTTGLPENLMNGSKAATNASGEVVSPVKLAPKVHALRDEGRLAEALNQSRADDLLRSVEAAKARTAQINATSKTLGTVAKHVGYVAGAGAVGGLGIEALRHTLE